MQSPLRPCPRVDLAEAAQPQYGERLFRLDGLPQEVDHLLGDRSPLGNSLRRGLLSSLTGSAEELRIEIGGMKLAISLVSKPLCNPTAMHGFINPVLWKSVFFEGFHNVNNKITIILLVHFLYLLPS